VEDAQSASAALMRRTAELEADSSRMEAMLTQIQEEKALAARRDEILVSAPCPRVIS